MAFLDRFRRSTTPLTTRHGVVASAAVVNLHDRREIRRVRQLRQGAQEDAFNYELAIGEIGFAKRYKANSAKRLRLFPAIYPEGTYDEDPLPFADVTGVPDTVIECCNDAMAALGTGRLAISQIMHDVSANFFVAGEAFIVGTFDPEVGEQWRIRSIREIIFKNDRVYLREIPQDTTGTMGWTPIDTNTAYIARIWNPRTDFRMLAQSSVMGIVDICEELLLSQRAVRASLRSRLVSNGLMKVPSGLKIAQSQVDDNLDPLSDPFVEALGDVLSLPISDEGAASALVPPVVRGSPDDLKALEMLQFPQVEGLRMEQRDECIRRMANGLDVPSTVLLGVAEVNHWNMWFVDQDTFRTFHEPDAQTNVDALTVGYLRARLMADARMQPYLSWVPRLCIWFDPSALIVNPNRMTDATTLYNANAISAEAWRKVAGFNETDKPGPLELVERLLSKQRTFPPAITEAFINRLDPTLTIPPTGAGGVLPGEGPEGLTPSPPPLAPGPPNGGVPPDDGGGLPSTPGVTAAAVPSRGYALSRRLVEIDREARASLQAAANAEVKRVLDRAGARLVSKARGDKALIASIQHTPPHLVASTLGPAVVAALGESDLVPTGWDGLRAPFDSTLARAAAGAVDVVGKLSHQTPTAEASTLSSLVSARAAAWEQFTDSLTAVATKYLYTPAPAIDEAASLAKAEDVTNLVPTSVIRQVMSIAGGNTATVTSTFPASGQVTATIGYMPGFGSGDIISGALTDGGAQVQGWEWVIGSPNVPFDPHQEIPDNADSLYDNGIMPSMACDATVNNEGWPDVGWFAPGDHFGCECDANQIWIPADEASDSGDDADNAEAA